jgi:hypothetical protein
MKFPILSPVYFPFTFMSPLLVEAISLCFDRLVVYQPAFAKPQQALQPWVDTGVLDLRSPFESIIDKGPLEAALRDFRSWGLLHQHTDMTYLKMAGNGVAPIDPEIARTASAIRGKVEEPPNTSEENDLSLQLFLHLAQEFDENSWELRDQLNRVNYQYHALQSAFRQDQNGKAHEPALKDLPARVADDDLGSFMIEKRMAAWNNLFQNDPDDTGLLFTDSHSAFAYLLDEVQNKVEVLKFSFTYNPAESKGEPKDCPTWANQLQEVFNTVITTPWSRTLQEEIRQVGHEIEARIDDWQRSTMKPDDRSISFRWYVVPDHVAHTMLNRRCDMESEHAENKAPKVKNTLVGMIEEGRPAVL